MPRLHDAIAYEASALLHLSTDDIADLLVAQPVFTQALLKLEARRLALLLAALEFYSVQPVERRLAGRLLMLAASFGRSIGGPLGLEINLRLPHEVLAELTGTTRQRIGQILNDWQSQGLVAHRYGRILVRDRSTLERIVSI